MNAKILLPIDRFMRVRFVTVLPGLGGCCCQCFQKSLCLSVVSVEELRIRCLSLQFGIAYVWIQYRCSVWGLVCSRGGWYFCVTS